MSKKTCLCDVCVNLGLHCMGMDTKGRNINKCSAFKFKADCFGQYEFGHGKCEECKCRKWCDQATSANESAALAVDESAALAEDEFLVVCIDATGEKTKGGMNIKNGYDEGQEFIACPSDLGDDYICVEDRYGKKRSVPVGQFELVDAEG